MKRLDPYLLTLMIIILSFVITGQLVAQPAGANQARVDTTLFRDMHFRSVGPTRGGRVAAVAGIPGAPHSFYMGNGPEGGVWRTDNDGQSWYNISDGKGFKSTSIGAIAVAKSDTGTVYVGTGTSNIRNNTLTGKGVYKSTDSGKHWQFIGLGETGSIGAIKVDPRDPGRVYVAAVGHPFGKNPQRGVFRSTNGGKTWQKVLFASDSTGAVDVALDPGQPSTVYATLWRGERKPWTIISGGSSADGLYKSTDGGDHWEKLEEGLPQGLIGRADIAATPAKPGRLYALIEASGDSTGLYRSEDRGKHWKFVNDTTGIMSRPFYFTDIVADPNNPDVVYVGNVSDWKSADAGKTFKRMRVPHGDCHARWINPNNSDIQVLGCDGGASVTVDNAQMWSTLNNQPTAELWQVNIDNQFPYRLYAGQQDKSTIMVPSLPLNNNPLGPKGWWQAVGGCETGPAVPAPDDSNIIYESCKGKFGVYNKKTGQEKSFWVGAQSMYGQNPKDLTYRFQRTSPIEIPPQNPGVLYYGAQYVLRTTNGGATWNKISPDLTAFKPKYQVTPGQPIKRDITGEENFSTLNDIQVSPHNKNVIWTSSNDGMVHITRNGGQRWTDITPKDLPSNARIDAIEPSPEKAGKAYVAAWRRYLDDFHPYIYSTTDYGKSWTLLTNGKNGIPAGYPTRVVREDPKRPGLLYAGTDWGFFISFDGGGHWQQFKQGLPTTAVTDIRIHDNDLALSTYGRGFWILDDLTVLRQLDTSKSNSYQFFKPEDAYRMRYRPRSSGVPQYPKPGAMIDFYLPDNTKSQVVMDIQDDQGHPVRSLVGRFEHEKKSGKGKSPVDATRADSVARNAGSFTIHRGHNRYIWDLRYPGRTVQSTAGDTTFGVRRGPLAAPGRYTVRLSAGTWNSEQSLRIKMDPRVKATGTTVQDLQDQLKLNLKIRDLIGQAKKMAADVDTLRSKLKMQIKHTSGDKKSLQQQVDKLDVLHKQLVTKEGIAYPAPKFIDQAKYLYRMTTSVDQRPGKDAYMRYRQLQNQLNKIDGKWQSLNSKGSH